MNRQKNYNALGAKMTEALLAKLTSLSSNPECKVVVLSGGSSVFSAGHDIKEVIEEEADHEEIFDFNADLNLKIHHLPVPVIAEVQGIATAAGCQLVAMCDLAISSNDSRFALSGINYGLACSTPSVPVSRNLSRKHAMEMLLTAQTAVERGLINKAVPKDKVEQEIISLCLKIIAKPRDSIVIGKKQFYRQIEKPIGEAFKIASQAMVKNMDKESAREGFKSFAQKRPADWKKPLPSVEDLEWVTID